MQRVDKKITNIQIVNKKVNKFLEFPLDFTCNPVTSVYFIFSSSSRQMFEIRFA